MSWMNLTLASPAGAKNILVLTALLMSVLSSSAPAFAARSEGVLQLSIVDAASGKTTPARVEILGADGKYHVAEDALLVGGDCDTASINDRNYPLESALSRLGREVIDPYTGATQFYSVGKSEIALPSGAATIRVLKGPEYEVAASQVTIPSGAVIDHKLELKRWVNMPARGWYSADDHLHIARSVRELNPFVSKMMQAEDIHVANLVQMGKADFFAIAPQYAHGPEGHYREHDHILAAGQENPRTHVLGHAITLGAREAIHLPETYLIYRLFWQEGVKQGGINGAAHYGITKGGQYGLSVVLPENLMHFIEVLSFNYSNYQTWYEILNLGFRVTPTAGTDYPCGDFRFPGAERFYTKVDGDFSYENWLAGVQQGRTFVSTGPLLEFSINGAEIGGEILLDEARNVLIEGRVWFNPETDNLAGLELIENGDIIRSFPRLEDKAEISFKFDHKVTETSWLALRGYSYRPSLDILLREHRHASDVHSAPIYVTIGNAPPLTASARTKAIARTWLSRLDNLEARLSEANIDRLAAEFHGPVSDSDDVPREIVVSNREALLREVQSARAFFVDLSD